MAVNQSSGKASSNYNPATATPVLFVPQLSDFFTTWPSGWAGKLTRTWILFFSQIAANTSPVIGFWMPGVAPGTNVGPMLASARQGNTSMVAVVIKASDASTNLSFDILQNGTSIFQTPPVVAAGTPGGTLIVITNLTSTPLAVSQNDIFSFNILTGSGSWFFTAQLQNVLPPSQ